MRVNSRPIKSLGNKVQKLRKKHDLTQEELASKIGVSAAYVGFIEQGQRNPSIKTADKIARALGTRLSELFD
jgi:DNA-binding XRE family transcriptional regulator